MKIYLVGGAVRDQLLGYPVKEKDWVVVGATPNDMLQKGFRQVGKDFPVFLHPETKEEYALARKERKIGRGYTGFAFNTDPSVTLEDDLRRRDVTINAMAETPEGEIIDPFGGREDLKQGILRHVSPAFAEDPVRILRVGRFSARFGFDVAPKTIDLMKKMVEQGEVEALVAERVWKELERALVEQRPEKFFEVLAACGADKVLFPDVDIAALNLAAKNQYSGEVRFATLLHKLPEADLKKLCDRYRVPSSYRDLALLVVKFWRKYASIEHSLDAEQILDLLMAVDAFRREARFRDFIRACEISIEVSDQTIQDLFETHIKKSLNIESFLLNCYQAAKNIDMGSIEEKNGKEIGMKIRELRVKAIKSMLRIEP